MRRFLAIIVVFCTVAVAVWLSIWVWNKTNQNPATDAATVTAPVVKITAVVPGLIQEVAVSEGQQVKKGDLLFRIDPESYELELTQAQAVLTTAEAELRQGERNLILEQANADVAANQIQRANNNLALAQATLARLEPLLKNGYVTAQEIDIARTAVRDATVTLEQSRLAADGTSAFIGTLDTRRAQVDLARATVALAQRNLSHTEIRAPQDGVLTGLKLEVGDFVVSAVPLFSLINNAKWRVNALFRETDLPRIKVGSSARVFLLASPNQLIEGHVSSISWGVNSTDEVDLFGLPLVASKLDWVQAARRFPVEIELVNPPFDATRLGASASVRVLVAQ